MTCDKCENKARFTMEGLGIARYLCASCAANTCLELGDIKGYEYFKAVA